VSFLIASYRTVANEIYDPEKLLRKLFGTGARLESEEHLRTCSFEALRESIYATSSQISGIQDLLVAQVCCLVFLSSNFPASSPKQLKWIKPVGQDICGKGFMVQGSWFRVHGSGSEV
jgi:hypothetical protein